MFEEILSEFTSSEHGKQAIAALAQQGIPAEQATSLIENALPAAASSFTQQTAGHPEPKVGLFNLFGGHAGRDFLAGLVAGLTRGDGLVGSVEDGALGVLVGHLTEYFVEREGMDGGTAGTIAAALAPFIAHFVHEKL